MRLGHFIFLLLRVRRFRWGRDLGEYALALYLPHYGIEVAAQVGVPYLIRSDDDRTLAVAHIRLDLDGIPYLHIDIARREEAHLPRWRKAHSDDLSLRSWF